MQRQQLIDTMDDPRPYQAKKELVPEDDFEKFVCNVLDLKDKAVNVFAAFIILAHRKDKGK